MGALSMLPAPALLTRERRPIGALLWVPHHDLCSFVLQSPGPLCACVLLAGMDEAVAVLRPASQVGYSGAWSEQRLVVPGGLVAVSAWPPGSSGFVVMSSVWCFPCKPSLGPDPEDPRSQLGS